jgi:hypothetical protein
MDGFSDCSFLLGWLRAKSPQLLQAQNHCPQVLPDPQNELTALSPDCWMLPLVPMSAVRRVLFDRLRAVFEV